MAVVRVPLPAGEALNEAEGDGPLTLAGFGSYFAGGRLVTVAGEAPRPIRFSAQAGIEHDPNGTFHIEQAYVQHFTPAGPARVPLVLVHGGCLTGAMWETTPDGRPGWLDRFLRAGHPVHVVDGVERGRAGWCALPGVWPDPPLMRSAGQMWELYRLGRPDGFATRTPFPGQQFPVTALHALLQQHVPRWFSTVPAAVDALVAVLERTGPAVVVSHSNGGLIALQAAWRRPELAAGLVCVEPSGFPDGPVPAGIRGVPVLLVMGDYLAETPLWAGLSDAAAAFAARLAGAGARVADWRLPERGMAGNSHLPMMDRNSDAVAWAVLGWIKAEVG